MRTLRLLVTFSFLLSSTVLAVGSVASGANRPFDPHDGPDPDPPAVDFKSREHMAPPHVKQELMGMRQFIQQNNLPFTVGYTSASERSLPPPRQGPDDKNRTPESMQRQNEEAARLIQQHKIPSVEQILQMRAQQESQGMTPGATGSPQGQIRPRGLDEESTNKDVQGERSPDDGIQSRSVATCAARSSFIWGATELAPMRDQGACGSCWAFAAGGVVDSSYRIRYNRNANVAEQELLDCAGGVAHTMINGCDGFYVEPTMLHMQLDGVAWEDRYPYLARDRGLCSNPPYSYRILTWGWAGIGYASVSQIKNALCQFGPVATMIEATRPFILYTGGVFQEKYRNIYGPVPTTNHAIMIVGWDDSKGAWRIKNSWGTGWGESGYAWVKYDHNAIGYDTVWAIAIQ